MGFSLKENEKKFLLLFFIGFAALYLLVQALPIEFALEGIASFETQALNYAGVAASSSQTIVFTPSMEFEIIKDCSGLLMVGLLAALLFSSSSDHRKSLSTLLLFAPLLLAFNLLRLFATLFVGAQYGQQIMDAVHFALWIVDSLIVLLIWWKSQPSPFT